MTERETAAPGIATEPLFFESGASWYWVLAGPVSGAAMLLIQTTTGAGVQPVVPLAFLVLVSAFVALQVKAARIHTSVELTAETLRQGTETIMVADIVGVYPEPKNSGWGRYGSGPGRTVARPNALASRALKKAGLDPADLVAEPADDDRQTESDAEAAIVEKWQSARALGELTGVPRGRTGIGLTLTGKRTAQAWARQHRKLRAALTALVEQQGDPPTSGAV